MSTNDDSKPERSTAEGILDREPSRDSLNLEEHREILERILRGQREQVRSTSITFDLGRTSDLFRDHLQSRGSSPADENDTDLLSFRRDLQERWSGTWPRGGSGSAGLESRWRRLPTWTLAATWSSLSSLVCPEGD